jgi:mannose/cellobiose epimerase-like protein (N-acyl-D-glucosamine 2-epimerase family)
VTAGTDPAGLRERATRILRAYAPDPEPGPHGGYLANRDPRTGEVYDLEASHLVAAARFVANFCIVDRLGGPDWALEAAETALDFLTSVHGDGERGGFHWLVEGRDAVDARRVCYGHAFAVLACARASARGVPGGEEGLDDALAALDRFFEPKYDLYASAFDADWTEANPYRGQNANMHACEALIAAHDATGETVHLDRAARIARRITVHLARGDRVWEHYTTDWVPDGEYNRETPRDKFRPWGYQPGHHLEWAKLCCELDARHEDAWFVPRARALFDVAVETGWEARRGGFVYTLAPDGSVVVEDRYGWTVAEGIGAAARLAERTAGVESDDGEDAPADRYRGWHDRLWAYADETFRAPAGCWYQKATPEGEPIVDLEGPAVEPGYHPIGACLAGVESFGETAPR